MSNSKEFHHIESIYRVFTHLWKINPCCPGKKDPLGDARIEKVSE